MAGRIPESFIDELVARVDIVEVVDSRVSLRKAGKEFQACCPFHDEKTPSFTVSPVKQFYHCFGCGAHGTAIGFLMEYEHLDFVSAIEELASQVGLEVPRDGGEATPGVSPDLYGVLEKASAYYQQSLRSAADAPKAVDYLKSRGLDGEIAARFGIGFAPDGWSHLLDTLGGDDKARKLLLEAGMVIQKDGGKLYDRFRDRVMFPIRDRRGRIIAFGGRVLGDGAPKYLNSPETPVFHKGRELYGLYEANKAIRHIEQILVVEGYMDVVALAQHGIEYAVATLGTATTEDHIERLFRVSPLIVFCFDGDRAGREAAWKAVQIALPSLAGGRQVRILMLPQGEDPDTLVRKLGGDEFAKQVANATPLSDWFFDRMTSEVDMTSREGRARLVEIAGKHIERMPPGVFRTMMSDSLSELAHIRSAQLGIQPSQSPAGRPQRGVIRDAGPSPVRMALAILIQRPDLATEIELDGWQNQATPGLDILVQVIETLGKSPSLTTGALIERWRETKTGHHLATLAQWDIGVPEDGLAAELEGSIRILRKTFLDHRIGELLAKERSGELDSNEKQELKTLFELRGAL